MAAADVTKPVLTSLILPKTIDVTKGNVAVTATVGATDVGLGVDYVYVSLDKSFQTTSGRQSYFFLYDSTESFSDGKSSVSTLFTSTTAAGTYGIQSVTVYDKAGNSRIYYKDELAGLGLQTSFSIKSNSAADVTKPVLTSLILPKTIDVTKGNVAVTATVGATDVGLGVDYVYVSLDKSFQTTSGRQSYFFLYDSTESFSDGKSSVSTLFTSTTAAGTYGIQSVTVYDKAGNSRIYYKDELASLGLQTSFTVSDITRVYGTPQNDILSGTAGPDLIDGKAGADTLSGLAGNDTYIIDNAGDRIIEAKGGGTDTVITSVSYALAAGQEIELLRTNASAAITAINLTGNEFANTLHGNAGKNVLNGGLGADSMHGGAGNDSYVVDNTGDRVFEAKGGGTDIVTASVSYALAAGQEIETLQLSAATGSTALNLTGNEFANTLRGNAGANVLNGGLGADLMSGGAGNDTYIVDNAGDRVFEAKGGGIDIVTASVSYTLAAGQEIETLQSNAITGSTALSFTGNEFANTLRGNAGANVLDGGLGADLLIGGGGSDIFVFATGLGAGNIDRIADFAVSSVGAPDMFHLVQEIFGMLTPGDLSETAFKDVSVGTIDANDRILYNKTTGALSYDADGSGTLSAAVQFAVLDNKAALTHHDFFVI